MEKLEIYNVHKAHRKCVARLARYKLTDTLYNITKFTDFKTERRSTHAFSLELKGEWSQHARKQTWRIIY